MITKPIFPIKIKLLTLLTACLTLTPLNNYAAQNTLNADLFNKLKNVPTLDLANPKLESKDYKPLGLAIIQPTPTQKAAILTKIKSSPRLTQSRYINLANCSFIGVNIELDNQNTTQEYLFTPTNNCIRPTLYQNKPFWILQQTANKTPQIILADQAYQVRVWKKEAAAAKRRIETITKGNAPSRYTQKPMEVRCHSNWSFIGSRYQFRPDYLEVYRSTPSSSGKAWVIVEGQDPYVAIDQNFRCPQ